MIIELPNETIGVDIVCNISLNDSNIHKISTKNITIDQLESLA